MTETVVCYISDNDKILMIYRNKKENDISHGKYLGIGGHVEEGETPDEAVKREVKEETNLDLINYKKRGLVHFIYNGTEELMHVYEATRFEGVLGECNEGTLSWVLRKNIFNLNLWEGDIYFLKPLFETDKIFEFKFYYNNDDLIKYEEVL